MTPDEARHITSAIETAIKPLETGIGELRSDLIQVRSDVTELKETVQSNTGSLMRIEQDLGAFRDGYRLTKERTDGLTKRVETVEERLGLAG